MDDVAEILDEIRQKMLAELRELRKGACGPCHSDTFAVARDEFLKRLELRILGTAPKRKPNPPRRQNNRRPQRANGSSKIDLIR
jgi:hypothetical protein